MRQHDTMSRPRAKLAALAVSAALALSAPIAARARAQAQKHHAAAVVDRLQRASCAHPQQAQ
jgi:hypothetical protein